MYGKGSRLRQSDMPHCKYSALNTVLTIGTERGQNFGRSAEPNVPIANNGTLQSLHMRAHVEYLGCVLGWW